MKTKQQLFEDKIRKIVKEEIDSMDIKAALKMVNSLSGVPNMDYITNDQQLKNYYNQISKLRIEIMNYIEKSSQYKFNGASGNNWKLVKK